MTNMKNVDKISRVILNLNNELIVKLNCRLTKEVNGVVRSFHNFFTYGDANYLNLEHYAYLTLEMKQELTAWNPDQRLILNSKNMQQFLKAFKYMINLCNRSQGLYIYTTQTDGTDKITISNDNIMSNIIKLKLLGDEMPRIILHPSVKIDRDGKYKPAIRMYINRKTIYKDITIEEAESLYYNLSKVDFFQYGMMMIQYYVSSVENNKVEVTKTEISKPRVTFNDKKVEPTKSILQKDKSSKEFFDL